VARKGNSKWLRKNVRRVLKRHGADILIGMLTGIATNWITDIPGRRKQRSQSDRAA
jgi:hypothetical protein